MAEGVISSKLEIRLLVVNISKLSHVNNKCRIELNLTAQGLIIKNYNY